MPLPVRDIAWHETIDHAFLSIPLKGVKREKVDILATDDYVKVNFPPHFFELFPFAAIDADRSAATIADGCVNFRLLKRSHETWGQLRAAFSDDKALCREKRLAALVKFQNDEEEKRKKREATKHELKRFTVQKQIDADAEQRRRITDIVEETKKDAMDDLEEWREAQEREEEEEARKAEETRIRREKMLKAKREKEERMRKRKEEKENGDGDIFDEAPPIRRGGKIRVNFTERSFPTPVRESTTPAENEWLKKQAEARKACDVEDENLKPEEKNPEWLQEKGDTFLRQENYQAAVNAYGHGIRLGGKNPLPSLLSSRAACHLRLRNLHKAFDDATRALDLLTPPVPQNAAARAEAHARRGEALTGLECYVEALVEYEGAHKIDRDDEAVEKEILRLRKIIQGSEEEKARKERRDKERGDGDGGVEVKKVEKKLATTSICDDDDDDDEKDAKVQMDIDKMLENERERRNDVVLERHK